MRGDFGVILTVLSTWWFWDVSTADTLRLTQVLFRHGDRSATQTYPTDAAGEAIWPQGFGQLTKTGMQQHYSLGQFFRKRYVKDLGLLHSNYTKNQIYIRSSDFERTLMSAESNLAGLFPPDEDQQWEDGVGKLWQPIPVHTVPQAEDKLLLFQTPDGCPMLDHLRKQLSDSHPYIEITAKNKKLIDFLAEKSGLPAEVDKLIILSDIFYCQKQHNLTRYWPNWINETVFGKLIEFRNFWLKVEHSVPGINRLQGGPIISEMVKNMDSVMKHNDSQIRMYMFSAHDSTVSALLSALGVFDPPVNPPYISCVMVELYQRADSSYFVQVFFRNDSTGQIPPYKLHIPGCDSVDCEFSKFREATKSMRVENYEEACKTSLSPSAASIAITVFAVLLMAVVLFTLSYCYLRRKRKSRYLRYRLTEPEADDDDIFEE